MNQSSITSETGDRWINYPFQLCYQHCLSKIATNTIYLMQFRDMKRYFPVIITLLVLFSTYVYAVRSASKHASNSTSALDEKFGLDFDGSAVESLDSPYLQLPVFLHSRIPILDKKQFSPMRGTGREQLPEETKQVLVPRTAVTLTLPEASRRRGRSQGVNVVCQMKKMIVKVHKHILGIDGLHSELKLGTCDISKTTKHYHVFIYDMDKCGSKTKVCLANVFFSSFPFCLLLNNKVQ